MGVTEIVVGAAIMFVIVSGLLLRMLGGKPSIPAQAIGDRRRMRHDAQPNENAVSQNRSTVPAREAPPEQSIAATLVKLDRPQPAALVTPASVRPSVSATLPPTAAQSQAAPVTPTASPSKTEPGAATPPSANRPLPPQWYAMKIASQSATNPVTAPALATVNQASRAVEPAAVAATESQPAGDDGDAFYDTSERFAHLHDIPYSRPKSRGGSIWSKTRRRTIDADEMEIFDLVFGQHSVKAERLPMRAETRLVGQSAGGSRVITPVHLSETQTTGTHTQKVAPLALFDIKPALPPGALETVPPIAAMLVATFEAAPPPPQKRGAIERSRIKAKARLVGLSDREEALRSTTIAATKVLGADSPPLLERLTAIRSERRSRSISKPLRKLYLASADHLDGMDSAFW